MFGHFSNMTSLLQNKQNSPIDSWLKLFISNIMSYDGTKFGPFQGNESSSRLESYLPLFISNVIEAHIIDFRFCFDLSQIVERHHDLKYLFLI